MTRGTSGRGSRLPFPLAIAAVIAITLIGFILANLDEDAVEGPERPIPGADPSAATIELHSPPVDAAPFRDASSDVSNVRVFAIVEGMDRRSAMVRVMRDGIPSEREVTVGDVVDGYTVTCIETQSVCLSRGGDTVIARLDELDPSTEPMFEEIFPAQIVSTVNYDHLYGELESTLMDPSMSGRSMMLQDDALVVMDNSFDYMGLEAGDRILSINQGKVRDMTGVGALGSTLAGGRLRLEVDTGATVKTVEIQTELASPY